jgi:hypothetical protein
MCISNAVGERGARSWGWLTGGCVGNSASFSLRAEWLGPPLPDSHSIVLDGFRRIDGDV